MRSSLHASLGTAVSDVFGQCRELGVVSAEVVMGKQVPEMLTEMYVR